MTRRRMRRTGALRQLWLVSVLSVSVVAGVVGAVGVDAASAQSLAGTAVSLRTTATPVYLGQPGRLVARVRSLPATAGVPTGVVDFSEDGYVIASVTVGATGSAVLPLATLWPGTHTIVGTYTGDATHAPSTSTPVVQEILANVPVAGVQFTPSTVAPGTAATLVVTATNTGPTNLGSVAMGVTMPFGYQIVSRPAGQLCGARPGIVYCMTSIPKGVTRTLTLKVMAPATPGSYGVSAYARNVDTGDETGAGAALTVQ